MTRLDSREEIAKIDPSNILGSVEALPDQIFDTWTQAKKITFPDGYNSVSSVIVAGMGGSALGSIVLKHLFKDQLAVPIEIYSHYHLPGYVSSNSLVVLSSYSGTTEETLDATEDAIKVGAKIVVITSGGKLAELAASHNWPIYLIDPLYNPSLQPRMAIGYMITSQLAIFNKIGLINISEKDIFDMVDNLREMTKKLSVENHDNNPAKYLAYASFDKEVILVAAEHLIGSAHVTNNQLNENAKLLTAEWHLPEFNHHYMEALTNPKRLREDVIFLLYNSYLYSEELGKRVGLTQQVIEKSGYQVEVIQATATTKLEQVFEIILLGAFYNFYLSLLYGHDPAPIPNVDWFKQQMAK